MFLKIFTSILFICVFTFSLSGCFPVIFTGATKSGMEFAKDRTAGDTLTDIRISTNIKGQLLKSSFKNIFSRITIEVFQGRVFLAGLVTKNEYSLKAIEIAWNQPGVVEVINEIKIDEKYSNFDLAQYTRDTMITGQIKSKMILMGDIKFTNYTIITINDIVYLFGISRSEESLQKVAEIASNIHGVKKVISHVKVNNTARKVRKNDSNENIIDTNVTDDDDLVQTIDEKQDSDW